VLTHAQPVRVTRDLRARDFEAEVLRALLYIRAVDEHPNLNLAPSW
jgi:hypothetical protein